MFRDDVFIAVAVVVVKSPVCWTRAYALAPLVSARGLG